MQRHWNFQSSHNLEVLWKNFTGGCLSRLQGYFCSFYISLDHLHEG
jgi:hypothetical protein